MTEKSQKITPLKLIWENKSLQDKILAQPETTAGDFMIGFLVGEAAGEAMFGPKRRSTLTYGYE